MGAEAVAEVHEVGHGKHVRAHSPPLETEMTANHDEEEDEGEKGLQRTAAAREKNNGMQ